MGDALDLVLMKNCPTGSEFAVLNIMKSNNQQLVGLYRANKKLCTIIVLCQGKSHRTTLLGKTKNDDFPNGLAWEFIYKARQANKPLDASAIEMDVELD